MSLQTKRILFTILLLDFVTGIVLLYFAGADGSNLTGFISAFCIVSGLLGILFILMIKPRNQKDDTEDV